MCELAMLAVLILAEGAYGSDLYPHLATPGNEKRQYIGRTDEPLSDRAVTAFREQQEGTEAAAYPDIRFSDGKSDEAVRPDSGADLAGSAGRGGFPCSGNVISGGLRGKHMKN